MHPFEVLADPVRRRIVEVLAEGERASGEVVGIIGPEFGISQPAVSRQLGVLRDGGFARVRVDGQRRIYRLDPAPLQEVDAWLAHYRAFWEQALDDLASEIDRGLEQRRRTD